MTGWATTAPCGRRLAALWHLAGRPSPGIPASVILAVARKTAMASASLLPAFTWPMPMALRMTCSTWAVTPIGTFRRRDAVILLHASLQRIGLRFRRLGLIGCRWHDCQLCVAIWRWDQRIRLTPHHVDATGNQYVVTLTVTDNTGTTGALSSTINANAPPLAALTAACSGNTCTFDASGSSDPDGTIAFYSVSVW